MGYTNKLARSAPSFAGSESGMLCRAMLLGSGKAVNSSTMGYTNKLARSAPSFAGSESGMLCRAMLLGSGKAVNSLTFKCS